MQPLKYGWIALREFHQGRMEPPIENSSGVGPRFSKVNGRSKRSGSSNGLSFKNDRSTDSYHLVGSEKTTGKGDYAPLQSLHGFGIRRTVPRMFLPRIASSRATAGLRPGTHITTTLQLKKSASYPRGGHQSTPPVACSTAGSPQHPLSAAGGEDASPQQETRDDGGEGMTAVATVQCAQTAATGRYCAA